MKAIAAAYSLLSACSMLCTWIGALLDSAAWMRFGGLLLVLLIAMLPLGLVAAIVGLIRSRGKNRFCVLAFVLMICALGAVFLVHVGLTGGV